MQISLIKSPGLSKSRVTKALDVGNSSRKSPSVGAKKLEERPKSSGPKAANKPDEVPSSGNDNIDVDSVQADVFLRSCVELH